MIRASSGPVRRERAGVTLIELIVVCAIISIVTAVTIPVFDRAAATPIDRSRSTSIDDQLARCREVAIFSSRLVRVVLDSNSSSAWIGLTNTGGVAWDGPIALDSALILPMPRAEFVCHPSGAIIGPGLQIRRGRFMRNVVVDPIAGRISTS
jgi:prepilin-type N-terminal cleavage/methylation domain-containing protein